MNRNDLLGTWLTPLAVLSAPALAADYFSVEQVQKQLFGNANQFIDQRLTLDETQRDAIKQKAGVRQRSNSVQVWRAQQDQNLLGWLFIDDVIGKHEMITFATAISPQGKVLGVEIMSYRETHGSQIRGAAWREQFNEKSVTSPLKLGQDIANISGATLSCRNVTDGVRRLVVIHDLFLRHAS